MTSNGNAGLFPKFCCFFLIHSSSFPRVFGEWSEFEFCLSKKCLARYLRTQNSRDKVRPIHVDQHTVTTMAAHRNGTLKIAKKMEEEKKN